MKSHPGVAADMFDALADAGINIEIISTSSIRISCVVRAADVERAVQVDPRPLPALGRGRLPRGGGSAGAMRTSLGIWALGPMVTRFVPGGYQPQWAGRDHGASGCGGRSTGSTG